MVADVTYVRTRRAKTARRLVLSVNCEGQIKFLPLIMVGLTVR